MKKRLKQYLLNILAKSRRQEGFTLIEMVVVIAIIVILILLIVPNLIGQKQKAEDKSRNTILTQVELYKDDHPEKKNISLEDLEGDHYLTSDQVKKAKKNNITVENVNKPQ